MLLAWLGLLATLAGATAMYAGTPNQKLLREQASPRLWFRTGCGLWVSGLLLLLTWAGPATAIFMALTAAMLSWSLFPILLAWQHDRRGAGK